MIHTSLMSVIITELRGSIVWLCALLNIMQPNSIISGRNWGKKKRLHYFFNNFLLTLRKEPSLGQFSLGLGLVYLRKSIFLWIGSMTYNIFFFVPVETQARSEQRLQHQPKHHFSRKMGRQDPVLTSRPRSSRVLSSTDAEITPQRQSLSDT